MFRIAFRNIYRQRSRYGIIFAAIVVGFAVIVALLGVSAGINRSLQSKAASYFGGEVTVTGYSQVDWDKIEAHDQRLVLESLKSAGVPYRALCRRSTYESLDAAVFFNGELVRQRRVVGVDWELESALFSSMGYQSGGVGGMGTGNGILVSSQVAAKTGIRAGDECMVVLTTRGGAKNTVNLIVCGVYLESSFFGATAYMDLAALNRVWGVPEDTVTDMGLVLAPGVSQSWAAERLHEALGRSLPVFDIIKSREQRSGLWTTPWDGRKYGVMTLDAQLSTINDILGAIVAVTGFLIALFLVIVVIGISNTYRMIVHERTREIGTMRAFGMQRSGVAILFLVESALLGVGGCVVGSALGVVGLGLVSLSDFSSIALASMFLEQGHLAWYLPVDLSAVAFLVMVLSAVGGALGPSRQAAAITPVKALSQET
jgi:putative ABC transport system permease protein